MQYEKMIKTEDSAQMYDAWASYRKDLTAYISDRVDDYYRRKHLLQTGKLRDKSFSMETVLEKLGEKPVVAIWGAGNCSDLDLHNLSRFARLVLIDREVDRIIQARNRYGLSERECQCVDLGFWEIYEEEEQWFASLLKQNADEEHLAQYLNRIEQSVLKQQADCLKTSGLFDFSVTVGLASQLNARFWGLLHIYGRNIQSMPRVKEALMHMNMAAAGRLYDAVIATTKHAVFCGNELCFAECEQQETLSDMAAGWSDSCEEALYRGACLKATDQCEVAGSREFLQILEAGIEQGETRIAHRRGMVWPFSPEKYYFMDVLMLEFVNKKTRTY